MRFRRRFAVIPAAYVVLRADDGRVLLQLRQNTGYLDDHWAIGAAGHVEAGESVFEAGCREAAEELGVEISPDGLEPLCVLHRTGNSRNPIDERVDFFFQCRRWQGEPRRREPDYAAELRWVSLDALPEPVVPHERFVLERWREGTLAPVMPFGFG